jgi:hypothetical protein
VGTDFRKRSCSNNKVERDGDSRKSHPALGCRLPIRTAPFTLVLVSFCSLLLRARSCSPSPSPQSRQRGWATVPIDRITPRHSRQGGRLGYLCHPRTVPRMRLFRADQVAPADPMSVVGQKRPSRSGLPHVRCSAHSGSPSALSPCPRSANNRHRRPLPWTRALSLWVADRTLLRCGWNARDQPDSNIGSAERRYPCSGGNFSVLWGRGASGHVAAIPTRLL